MKIVALTLLSSISVGMALGTAHADNKAGRNAAALAARLLNERKGTLASRDGRSVAELTPSAIRVTTKHADPRGGETIRAFSLDERVNGMPARIRTTAYHGDQSTLTQRGPAGAPDPRGTRTSITRVDQAGKPHVFISKK